MSNEKRIKGFSDYVISETGRIIRKKDNKVVKPYKVDSGYIKVELQKSNGEWVDRFLHVLLAEVYKDNPYGYKYVNHKDGDKSNYRLSNLEWVSAKGNVEHAIKKGLTKIDGMDNGRSKLTNSQVVNIFKAKQSLIDLANKYNVSISTIKNIRYGKSWTKLLKEKGLI